jgi:hypothetical protein
MLRNSSGGPGCNSRQGAFNTLEQRSKVAMDARDAQFGCTSSAWLCVAKALSIKCLRRWHRAVQTRGSTDGTSMMQTDHTAAVDGRDNDNGECSERDAFPNDSPIILPVDAATSR